MMYLLLPLILTLASIAQAAALSGKVEAVKSGDTLSIQTPEKRVMVVRLFGISAPDPKQEAGQRSQQELSTLALGKNVTFEIRPKDRSGVHVGWVAVEKLQLNVEMVRRGLAWWNVGMAKGDLALEAAQVEAQKAWRGLWATKAEAGTNSVQQAIPRGSGEALKWYQEAAARGDPEAQYILGVKLHNGDGVPKNPTEAVKWIRSAADRGVPNAQAYLGSLHLSGDSVSKDLGQAVLWFRKAAEKNQSHAQASLGRLYRTGQGVEQNIQTAHFWCTLAATQGNLAAKEVLLQIEAEMNPEQRRTAQEWAKRVADLKRKS
jgi:endonuclease YncB( thermonuclease family)